MSGSLVQSSLVRSEPAAGHLIVHKAQVFAAGALSRAK